MIQRKRGPLPVQAISDDGADQGPPDGARARIAHAAGIRPGEGRLVGWMAALFAVTQASQGLGATTADTLFLLRFGVDFLPVMILASGAAVMLATILHMAGIARFGAGKWLAPVLLALGAWVAIDAS